MKKLARQSAQEAPEAQNDENELEAQESENVQETQGNEAQRASICTDVKAWTEKYSLIDAGFLCSVYKYTGDSRERKELCFQYRDEIPDEHRIGETFGAGSYECIFNGMDNAGKRYALNRKFKLNKNYDLIKEQKDREKRMEGNAYISPQTAAKVNSSEIGQALFIMKDLFSMIIPLIQLNTQNKPAPANGNPFDGYKMYNEALKQSVIDNTQFYNDMQRKIGSLSETVESEGEVNTGNTFLNYVMPLLDKFLPLIIGGKKTSNETINNFKHIPQVDAILKDKDKLKILLDNIKKTKGLATYNRVVRALQENKIL